MVLSPCLIAQSGSAHKVDMHGIFAVFRAHIGQRHASYLCRMQAQHLYLCSNQHPHVGQLHCSIALFRVPWQHLEGHFAVTYLSTAALTWSLPGQACALFTPWYTSLDSPQPTHPEAKDNIAHPRQKHTFSKVIQPCAPPQLRLWSPVQSLMLCREP